MAAEHDQALGTAVRELRTARKLTIERLAHESEVTTATLSKIELAQSDPRWSTIRALMLALDADYAELGQLIDAARQ